MSRPRAEDCRLADPPHVTKQTAKRMHLTLTPRQAPTRGEADDDHDAMLQRAKPDPWQSAISALAPRPTAAFGWPTQQSRVVRLVDDEPRDLERDARVEELFRSLPADISQADGRILYALADAGPASQRALARLLEMDRAYLSRRLRKLVDQGLVAHDGRGWRIRHG